MLSEHRLVFKRVFGCHGGTSQPREPETQIREAEGTGTINPRANPIELAAAPNKALSGNHVTPGRLPRKLL